jgi:hypothetical protein
MVENYLDVCLLLGFLCVNVVIEVFVEGGIMCFMLLFDVMMMIVFLKFMVWFLLLVCLLV